MTDQMTGQMTGQSAEETTEETTPDRPTYRRSVFGGTPQQAAQEILHPLAPVEPLPEPPSEPTPVAKRDKTPGSGRQPSHASSEIRRRLREGERFTAKAVAEEYKCSTSLLGTIVMAMERFGATFSRRKMDGGFIEYHLVTPPSKDPQPRQSSKHNKPRSDTAKGYRKGSSTEAVIEYMATNPYIEYRPKEVGDALGLSHATISKAFQTLLKLGTVKRIKPGRYMLKKRRGRKTSDEVAVATGNDVVPAMEDDPMVQSLADLGPIPALGGALSVRLLALDDDNHLTIGLRNGDSQWLVEVQGSGTIKGNAED